MKNGGYEDGYSQCQCFWGENPANHVQQIPSLFDSVCTLKALDVGCGEGKNSNYMARLGIEVDAIDISKIAIDKARLLWPNEDKITWKVSDVRKICVEPLAYDIVVSTGSLHCLSDEIEITYSLNKIKEATKQGGINIISAFNSGTHDFTGHGSDFTPYLVSHDFFEAVYSDWHIIEISNIIQDDIHPHTNMKHMHSITRLIARKL